MRSRRHNFFGRRITSDGRRRARMQPDASFSHTVFIAIIATDTVLRRASALDCFSMLSFLADTADVAPLHFAH